MINKNISAGELVQILNRAKELYYKEGSSDLSDSEFDEFEDLLRQKDPQNSYFARVGVNLEDAKINHTIPMLSAGKAKTLEDVDKWLKKLNLTQSEYAIEPKIDGLSATCRYTNGKLDYIATRGDGHYGQDISHVADYMASIPKTLPKPLSLEVRGELYLPKNTTYDTQGRPLRNNCVGLINRKTNREEVYHVHFVAYNLVSQPYETEADAINFLADLGFETVEYVVVKERDEIDNFYQHYLDILRDQWPYETDGLIIIVNNHTLHDELDSRWVVDHHHHYAIAFKPPAVGKETVLQSVEWQISRSGSAIPVAIFDAIELGGAMLERATLHNAQFARELLLVKGDHLMIERANDVIPYVRDNLNRHGREPEGFIHALIPLSCPSCQEKLYEQGVHLRCTNKNCREIKIQQILYWVKCCAMENIAEATIRTLYERQLVTKIADLYSLKASDFILLPGFAEKKIDNILSEVERSRTMSPPELISRLGIPLVAEKALKKLKIHSMEDFFTFHDVTYVIGRNLIEWRDEEPNRELVNELQEALILTDGPVLASKGEVCMTGKGFAGRHELEVLLKQMGYENSGSVTAKTQFLICDDKDGSSSKLQKARKLNIPIVTYDEFFQQ